MIEFAAADAEADRAGVRRGRFAAPANHANAKSGDRLKRAAAPVVVAVDFELVDHLRCNPPGADLVARERGPIDDDDVEAGAAEGPGARRPGRSAADDDDVTRVHPRAVTRSR